MSTKSVIFSNPDDVIDFVKIVEKYPFDMDMKRGRYIVDAKSLLGLMNLGFDHKIELKVYEEECENLWKELDKFVAAQVYFCSNWILYEKNPQRIIRIYVGEFFRHINITGEENGKA